MPFVLLILGTVFLVAAIRGTQDQLGTLIKGDFTGSANFTYWLVVLLIIGAIGYIPKLKPVSVAFLTLLIMVIFLKKGNPGAAGGGFFAQLTQQLQTTTTAQPATGTAQTAASTAPSGTSPLSSSLPGVPQIPHFGGLQ